MFYVFEVLDISTVYKYIMFDDTRIYLKKSCYKSLKKIMIFFLLLQFKIFLTFVYLFETNGKGKVNSKKNTIQKEDYNRQIEY